MLIWIIMAIVLAVSVLGGFVGRHRIARQREEARQNEEHHVTHHGKGARNSRGRGRRH